MDRRVQFDFEVDFSNGGGIQGQGFRLDIDGEDIADDELAAFIIRDLRLLMVGDGADPQQADHPRAPQAQPGRGGRARPARLIDLSHVVEDGMITYKGLPAPWCATTSAARKPRALRARDRVPDRQIDRWWPTPGPTSTARSTAIADGIDLAGPAARAPGRPRRRGRRSPAPARAVDRAALSRLRRRGPGGAGPHRLGPALAHRRLLRGPPVPDRGRGRASRRPAARARRHRLAQHRRHRRPAAARSTRRCSAPASRSCEHLTDLGALPAEGFRFFAVPVKVRGMGTFPVRAHAVLAA